MSQKQLSHTEVWNSDRNSKPNYALGQPKQSPISLLSNLQKLNNVQGGIA